MSTRALVILQDDEGKEIVVVYHHSDGYPTGLGTLLKDRFGQTHLDSSIRSRDSPRRC